MKVGPIANTVLADSHILIEGVVMFTKDEVLMIAGRIEGIGGTEAAFEDALRQCGQLQIPKTHDIHGCHMKPSYGTSFERWQFSLIALPRFR